MANDGLGKMRDSGDANASDFVTAVLEARGLSIRYGENAAVRDVSLEIPGRGTTAIIGPSGCGKTTLLRSFNRLNDFVAGLSISGEVFFQGRNIYAPDYDPVELRRRIGMIFQKPNPFPMSIEQNIAWGPAVHDYKGDKNELVENSLRRAALWDEVKDKLDEGALSLSGGQQQRLCIARAIAMEPEVILMDEPLSALDPISAAHVEDLICELAEKYTIIVVLHNLDEARRISQHTAFMQDGELVEFGPTAKIFSSPENEKTKDYIADRFE